MKTDNSVAGTMKRIIRQLSIEKKGLKAPERKIKT